MKRAILALVIGASALWPVAPATAVSACDAAALIESGASDITHGEASVTAKSHPKRGYRNLEVTATAELAAPSCENVTYSATFYDFTTGLPLATFSVPGDGSQKVVIASDAPLADSYSGQYVNVVLQTSSALMPTIDRAPDSGFGEVSVNDPGSGGQGWN